MLGDKEVANCKVPHTIPFIVTLEETLMAASIRAPVDDKDYQVPFRFTGRVAKLTYKLAPMPPTSEDHQVIRHALARSRD
ncbi:hypothetical protein IVB30_29185 [Bradyrhizobium sp. 200]|uniref:hypothetical protein n=1 Tax=Bradyrhizobium sp. 200 TaxID=2782665 RepID=UPI001FFF9B85|nr:hypothetical protein [Bradyrhizobium sp. 200]UPJ47330.1 hypothetical protein IVB30_29185 [Bradyrhizobium sp. 200]